MKHKLSSLWRYLKYFIPIVLPPLFVFIPAVGHTVVTLLEFESGYGLVKESLWLFLFSSSWYIFHSKPQYIYKIPLLVSLWISFFLLLSFVFFPHWDYSFFDSIFWGMNLWNWYFLIGLTGFIIVYFLRFYHKERYDILGIIKFLLIALLYMVTSFSVIFRKEFMFFAMILIFLMGITLLIVHLIDMIRWELSKPKKVDAPQTLEVLIDQISGTEES